MAIQDSDKVANGKYTSTKFDPNPGNNERGGAGVLKPAETLSHGYPGLTFNNSEWIRKMEYHVAAHGLKKVNNIERFHRFARHSRIDPYSTVGLTKEYIFMTKPDLYIFNRTGASIDNIGVSDNTLNPISASNSIFRYAHIRNPDVLDQLVFSRNTSEPFMNLISNQKISNIDLPDISTSADYETGKNIMGSSMYYRGSSYESDEGHEFSIEFLDTKNLDVYMLLKLYDEYERMKHYGLIYQNNSYYTANKTLHDQMTLYKFIVGPDGQSIIHFSKYYGVYPKSVPRGAFSDMPEDGNLKYSVNFRSIFVEDMDLAIITEFNELSDKMVPSGSTNISSNWGGYLDKYEGHSGAWMVRPRIVSGTEATRVKRQLYEFNRGYNSNATTDGTQFKTSVNNYDFKLIWEGEPDGYYSTR